MRNLVVGGMMRSGTTLLQKALDAHPEISVAYQSLTDEYLAIKKRFLSDKGINSYHLLAHYNPAVSYSFTEFNSWLGGQDLPKLKVNTCNVSKYFGNKEVLVEEFFPAHVAAGDKVINIVRDPRDVIASMSFGKGVAHTGKRRPVLFDIRNWRKSFYFSQMLLLNKNFKLVSFENLLKEPKTVLGDVFAWLDVGNVAINDISQALEKNWVGNSSFTSKKAFDVSAIGGYESNLPESVVKYVEAICYREMIACGYQPSIDSADRENLICTYSDEFAITRDEFPKSYSNSKENIEYEVRRLGLSADELKMEMTSV